MVEGMKGAALLLFAVATMTCDGANQSPVKPTDATVVKPADAAPAKSTDAKPTDAKPATPAQPELSAATRNIIGPATADVLLRGTDRATFRVDARDFVRDGADRFAGYRVLRAGRALTDDEMRRLATLLLSDASYFPVDKAVCPNEEAYGLRVRHGAEVVELLFVFPCDRVSILRRASGDAGLQMAGEYIDPVGDEVVALLRAAAP